MTDVIENDLNSLTKDELLATGEQFGVDVKKSMSKADIIAELEADGVTIDLIRGLASTAEDKDEELVEELDDAPVADEDSEDDDLVLVRMIRANNTYQIRGYTFKQVHPFALVKEKDADYLVEVDGGFRMASPKEAREFYG